MSDGKQWNESLGERVTSPIVCLIFLFKHITHYQIITQAEH